MVRNFLNVAKAVLGLALLVVLPACETDGPVLKAVFPPSLAKPGDTAAPDPNRYYRGELVTTNGAGDALRQPEFYNGHEWERRTGIVDKGLRVNEPEDTISINFVDTSIREVLDVILTRTLKQNYFIDERVRGNVTARTSKPIARADLLSMLENILALNGAAIVESNGILNVVPVAAVPALSKEVVVDPKSGPRRAGVGIYLIPLKYATVDSVFEVVQRQVSAGNELALDRNRDMLIYTGPGVEARAIAEMVDVLDIDGMKGMSFALLPVQHADAQDVLQEVQAILSSNGSGLSDKSVQLVVIERMNGILAISKRPAHLRTVNKWIRRLDRADAQAGSRVYVYYARNRRAADLAEILQQIFASEDSSPVTSDATGVAPGLEEVRIAGDADSAPPTVADAGSIVAAKDNKVRIVADERRNALVIVANARQYQLIAETLKRIDIVPLQVLVEATIAEVTLSDELTYGLQWAFSAGNLTGSLVNAGTSGVSGSFPGFNLMYQTGDARAVLSALSEVTHVSVISSPQLTVLDNQTARLQVGDSVPVSTQTSVSTSNPDAPTVSKIEYFDTGVILEVTPHVNASGQVTMDILQEVSDAVRTQSSGINSPTISQRSFKSTVSIASGATVAMGGLIRDTSTNGDSGLPGARKAGLLGNLFKTRRKNYGRTELLVLITPRVIRNPYEAQAITRELRNRLRNINGLAN